MNHKSVMEILEKRFGDKAWSYNNQLLLLGKINDTEHKLHEERIHIEIDQALSDLKQLIPSEGEIRKIIVNHCGVEDKVYPLNKMGVVKKTDDEGRINHLLSVYLNTTELATAIRAEMEKRFKE